MSKGTHKVSKLALALVMRRKERWLRLRLLSSGNGSGSSRASARANSCLQANPPRISSFCECVQIFLKKNSLMPFCVVHRHQRSHRRWYIQQRWRYYLSTLCSQLQSQVDVMDRSSRAFWPRGADSVCRHNRHNHHLGRRMCRRIHPAVPGAECNRRVREDFCR
jgi:hypothetical protein